MIPVGVTGGRDLTDWPMVWDALNTARRLLRSHGGMELHVGDCPTGADRWARRWAAFYRQPGVLHVAHWTKLGRAAGPERNGRLVAKISALLTFPGGIGTNDCAAQAEKRDVAVVRIKRPTGPTESTEANGKRSQTG